MRENLEEKRPSVIDAEEPELLESVLRSPGTFHLSIHLNFWVLHFTLIEPRIFWPARDFWAWPYKTVEIWRWYGVKCLTIVPKRKESWVPKKGYRKEIKKKLVRTEAYLKGKLNFLSLYGQWFCPKKLCVINYVSVKYVVWKEPQPLLQVKW